MGIEYLKGVNDMSNEDYSIWRQHLLDSGYKGSKSFKQLDRVYKNQQFVNKFGKDVFNSMDAEQRDTYYNNQAIAEAFDRRYKEDISDFKDLYTPEAIKYLLENDYMTSKEREELAKDKERLLEEQRKEQPTLLGRIGQSLSQSRGVSVANRSQEDADAAFLGAVDKKRERLMQDARVIEAETQAENPINKQITESFENYYIDQMNSDIVNGARKTINEIDDFFTRTDEDTGQVLFPNYATFSENGELKLSDSEKIKLMSQYASFASLAEEAHEKGDDRMASYYYAMGAEFVENAVKRNIYDTRTSWRRFEINASNIAINAATMVVALPSDLWGVALDLGAAFDDDIKQQAINWHMGLKKDGSKAPLLLNQEFIGDWQNTGTFDPVKQQRIKTMGLVNANTHIRPAGEEYKWFTKETLGEGVQMLGYLMPTLVEMAVTKSASAPMKAMQRKLVTQAGKAGVKAQKAVKLAAEAGEGVAKASNYALHTIPMAASEARSAWDAVYDEVYSKGMEEAFSNPEFARNVIESAVEEQIRKEFPDGDVLKRVGEDTNALVNVTSARREELRQQYTKDYQNFVKKKVEEAAKEAAFTAFDATFASLMLKNLSTDRLMAGWKYYKSPFSKLGEAGKHAAWFDYTKKIGGSIFGSALDEFTDEMVNQGSQQLGLDVGNNYLQHLYNTGTIGPVSSVFKNIFDFSTSYIEGASGATMDPSAWQQAFVGGVAPLLQASPKVGMFDPSTYKNWRQNSTIDNLNKMLFNPILSDIGEVYNERKKHNEEQARIEKIMQEHAGDYKNLMTAFSMLSAMENDKAVRDKKNTKDDHFTMGFQFLINTEELSQEHPEVVEQYMQELQEAAQGNITEEEIQQYIAANEKRLKKGTNEANVSEAREQIQKNAQEMLKLHEAYKSMSSMLNSVYGDSMSKEAKNQLTYMSLMGQQWQERLQQMQKELGVAGNATNTGVGALTERGIQEREQQVRERIKEIDDILQNKKVTGLREKYFKKKKKELQESLKMLDNPALLTAEEILNLSANERNNMFHHKKSNYTYEQEEEIEKAENMLAQKDPEYLSKLEDIETLQDKIEYNNEAYKYILSKPQELEQLNDYNKKAMLRSLWDKVISNQANTLHSVLSTTPINADFYKKLNSASRGVLEELSKIGFVNPDGTADTKRNTVLYNAIENNKFFDEVNKIIDTWDILKQGKDNIKRNVMIITESAKTTKDAILALERAIDDPNVDNNTKSWIDNILNSIDQVGYQRSATKVQKREAKRKREENKAKEEKAKQEEKKQIEEKPKVDEYEPTQEEKEKAVKEGQQESIDFSDEDNSIKTTEKSNETKPEESTKSNEEPTKEDPTTPETTSESVEESNHTETTESVNSPTEEEEVQTKGVEVQSMPTNLPTSIEDVDRETSQADKASSFLGLPFYRYVIEPLRKFKTIVLRKSRSETDIMGRFFKWCDNMGINMQEIVDYELARIRELNPDVQVVITNPVANELDDACLEKIPLLVVEYTDAVKKIHGGKKGGVITADGKNYLVIGSMGYISSKDRNNPTAQEKEFRNRFLPAFYTHGMHTFVGDRANDRFTVYPYFKSKIKFIATGNLVKRLATDEESSIRSVSELINDATRNPLGVQFDEIPWMIQMTTKYVMSKALNASVNLVRDDIGNAGNLFMLVKSSNGDYIPIAIKPTKVGELKDSPLKDHLIETIRMLYNTDHAVRYNAVRELCHWINLDNTNNIFIGTKDRNNITIRANGVDVFRLNLDKPSADQSAEVQSLINAIFNVDNGFRVNFTASTIKNVDEMKMMDEAGALQTDAALLGTAGSYFDIYNVDTDGKPINVQQARPIEARRGSALVEKVGKTVLLDGKTYRIIDNVYYDENDKVITDSETIQRVDYVVQYNDNPAIKPDIKDGVYDAYVVNTDSNNPLVLEFDQGNHVKVLKGEDALKVIDRIEKKKQAEKAKEKIEAEGKKEQLDFDFEENNNSNTTTEPTVEPNAKESRDNNKKPAPVQTSISFEEEPEQPKPKRVRKSKKNVNEIEEKSSPTLHNSDNLHTFAGIIRNKENRKRVKEVLTKKFGDALPKEQEDQEAFLRSKKILTQGINNIDTWLEMIENCR